MRFDLVDLRLFVHVHDGGSITAGAARSHMTLASASERIRGMEAAIGVPLLERDRRGVTLAPAGRTLLRHARRVLGEVDSLGFEMSRHGKGLAGTLRVLCNTSALSEHLPQALAAFLAAHPRLSIELEERPSDRIVDAIRDESCDVGVVSDAADLAGLENRPFRPDPLVVVVPRDHPRSGRAEVRFADVVDEPFVGLVDGSALQALVAGQARRLRRTPNPRVRVGSLESVCRLVGLGVGIGVVPRAVAVRCRRSCGVVALRLVDPWASRTLVVCARSFEALPTGARRLVEHLLADAVRRTR